MRLVDQSGHAGEDPSFWQRHGTRVVGGLQVLGGALEIVAGAAGIAVPTGVTQVLGAAAVVHGVDTLSTGLTTLWTGQVQETLTQQAATGAAKLAGASPETARKIGTGVDITAGIVPSLGIGVAKVIATRGAAEAGTQAAAHAVVDDVSGTLFRGTSEGFPGSAGLQKVGVTPASQDPLVAAIFATESQNYGRGVVQIATPANLQGVARLEGNVLAAVEREVVLDLLPQEFAKRAGTQITAAEARGILKGMGHTVPSQIRGPAGVTQALESLPRLTQEEIKLFVKQTGQISGTR